MEDVSVQIPLESSNRDLAAGELEFSGDIDAKSFDKTATVVVDMDSLQHPTDRSSGSPKMIRALSRKWSYRAERLTNPEEEDIDESSKRTVAKVLNTQLEPLKQSLLSNKSLNPNSTNHGGSNLLDAADGKNKKLNRFVAINPRKILCIFATLSSMGSLVLIYFTLAMNGTF